VSHRIGEGPRLATCLWHLLKSIAMAFRIFVFSVSFVAPFCFHTRRRTSQKIEKWA